MATKFNKSEQKLLARATLGDIVNQVGIFQRQCARAGYIDVGEAHGLLIFVVQQVRIALKALRRA